MLVKSYYMWKEMVQDEETGEWNAIIPWNDPMEYEYPINFTFDTMDEAFQWLTDDSEEWGVPRSESDDWVLVSCTEIIMPQRYQENGYPWEQ